ncbi:hypothetical protein CHS0354_022056 [Potamilus streckersoni]|uniref:Uncharacterized protein n=1 Tax=Potamilus streckersoni TaxID=2493646 RepID=A0AAE0SSY8_9BIVA|nr:hypothetical protein CHS0354_022056 [Potamilus streckersoni]
MLVDTHNSSCCLFDANFKHISHYVFQLTMCILHDVSIVSNTEVVVSLNSSKQLYFLNVEQKIRPTGNITTRFQCSGIATLYKDQIVVSGINDESNYYWSIISKTGEELSYHDIGEKSMYGGTTYLAVDESKTHIYMSCKWIHTLFCFNLGGQQIFTYRENELHLPTGIGLDDEGNIYLVDSSPKLHKLSPDGTFLEYILEYNNCRVLLEKKFNVQQNKPYSYVCGSSAGLSTVKAHRQSNFWGPMPLVDLVPTRSRTPVPSRFYLFKLAYQCQDIKCPFISIKCHM